MAYDRRAYLKELRANQKLPCKKPGCGQSRHSLWPVCESHVDELREKRRQAGIKATATKRVRYPHLFNPAGTRPDFKFQSFCHAAVHRAVKAGVLPDLSTGEYACTDCGGVASEYDHRDYARPLDVDPVCRSCNRKRGVAVYPSADRYQFAKYDPANDKRQRAKAA